MAKRKGTLEAAVLFVILLSVLGWVIGKILGGFGVVMLMVSFVAIVTAFVAVFIWFKNDQRQKRIKALQERYGDGQIVRRIVEKEFWKGQTAEQLRDSIGNPQGIDKKSMATRKREVWKYNRTGKHRYALRITLDDDVVSGWEQKNR
jgi:uncharacterized membrane protein